MTETIPLFPLGSVLFPGVVLPLHIFEPRYRLLVRRLMDHGAGTPREFGVVAIRQGHEVGVGNVAAMYAIGCTAELRQAQGYPDGTFDIVTVGRRRFRLQSVDADAEPYLCGDVEWLPEQPGPRAEVTLLAGAVSEVFGQYVRLLSGEDAADADPAAPPASGAGASEPGDDDRTVQDDAGDEPQAAGIPAGRLSRAGLRTPQLPDDPMVLSHLVAASAPLALDDRQSLLAEPDTVRRLRHLLRLLKREATMLRRLGAIPVPLAELRVPTSPN